MHRAAGSGMRDATTGAGFYDDGEHCCWWAALLPCQCMLQSHRLQHEYIHLEILVACAIWNELVAKVVCVYISEHAFRRRITTHTGPCIVQEARSRNE